MHARENPCTARCDGVTRRDFLHLGVLTSLGLGVSDLFRLQARAASGGKAKSCILIWLDGGPSHLDTFDPKPNAPTDAKAVNIADPPPQSSFCVTGVDEPCTKS